MKAAIYNPYLDTLGGGERYTIFFCTTLAKFGFNVDIEWRDKNILEKLKNRFGIPRLNNLNIVDSINRGDGYDLCFWVSDGSIPTLRSKNNIIHFQFPFKDVNGNSLLNKMKLFRVNNIVCNSYFTKGFIDKEYGVNSIVIYPPIDTKKFKARRKENIICYVGRFSRLTQAKGHNFLIDAFKNLTQDSNYMDWKLVLAGGVEIGVDDELKKLKKKAKNLKVEFLESPDFSTIVDLYGKSKFFWSATGYKTNEKKEPQKSEHFGMTLVEAMSAGAVPIVYRSGGFKEIINSSENGYLYDNISDLVKITKNLITNGKLTREMSKKAIIRSMDFDSKIFEKEVLKLIN